MNLHSLRMLNTILTGDRLPGGKADFAPASRFPKKKLEAGVRHEREHTSDADLAAEIARDHLVEDPDYYQKLKKVEKTGAPQEQARQRIDPYSTALLVRADVPLKSVRARLASTEKALLEAQREYERDPAKNASEQRTRDEALRAATDRLYGLKKVLRQREYNIRDSFLPAEARQMRELGLLTWPAHWSDGEKKDAYMGTSTVEGGDGPIKSATVLPVEELRVSMFLEGLAEGMRKSGMYIVQPLAFLTGLFEAMNGQDGVKVAATLPHWVKPAAQRFIDEQIELAKQANALMGYGGTSSGGVAVPGAGTARAPAMPPMPKPSMAAGPMPNVAPKPAPIAQPGSKMAQGFGGMQLPQAPKIPMPKPSAMPVPSNVDPERAGRRNDIIDEMLPHAHQIELDPTGKIKLVMPDPIAQQTKLEKAKAELEKAHAEQQMAADMSADPQGAMQQEDAGVDRDILRARQQANQANVSRMRSAPGPTAATPMQGGDFNPLEALLSRGGIP